MGSTTLAIDEWSLPLAVRRRLVVAGRWTPHRALDSLVVSLDGVDARHAARTLASLATDIPLGAAEERSLDDAARRLPDLWYELCVAFAAAANDARARWAFDRIQGADDAAVAFLHLAPLVLGSARGDRFARVWDRLEAARPSTPERAERLVDLVACAHPSEVRGLLARAEAAVLAVPPEHWEATPWREDLRLALARAFIAAGDGHAARTWIARGSAEDRLYWIATEVSAYEASDHPRLLEDAFATLRDLPGTWPWSMRALASVGRSYALRCAELVRASAHEESTRVLLSLVSPLPEADARGAIDDALALADAERAEAAAAIARAFADVAARGLFDENARTEALRVLAPALDEHDVDALVRWVPFETDGLVNLLVAASADWADWSHGAHDLAGACDTLWRATPPNRRGALMPLARLLLSLPSRAHHLDAKVMSLLSSEELDACADRALHEASVDPAREP